MLQKHLIGISHRWTGDSIMISYETGSVQEQDQGRVQHFAKIE